ncbi:MAG: PTS system mannose/fructose/sorbose family transporter subunit IID [Elusimicrobia bacterium]|nr:PTS system mannose/fructose/sorbose family transporter subunit IID [Elusimicrobiota bacterium]
MSIAMGFGMKVRVAARLLLLQARWDPARRQGVGFSFAVDPWLAACWSAEPDQLDAARRRHLEYFNTHPVAAGLVAGVVCRYEAAASGARGAEREALIQKIGGLKSVLGASLAAPCDSFFWGALRPASALIGLVAAQSLAQAGLPHPLALGASLALVVYNVPALAGRWLGMSRGFERGEAAAVELAALPVQSWISGLRRLAAVGAVASFVLGAATLEGAALAAAAAVFVLGFVLSLRGVSPLSQLGFAGLGGAICSIARLRP